MKTEFNCSQCKEDKVHVSDITTGYATNDKGEKICFDCCGKNDLNSLISLKKGEKICLYLVKEGNNYLVQNWPGTLNIKIYYVRKGKHNVAGSRYDFWFDLERHSFHGVQYGNNSDICHIKKVIK